VPDYVGALDATNGLSGIRVGVPREYFIPAPSVQPEVAEAVRAAIEVMHSLGAQVHEVSLPHTDDGLPVYYLIAPAEASANLARYDGVRYGSALEERSEAMWETIAGRAARALAARSSDGSCWGHMRSAPGYYDAYYLKAQQVRTLIQADFDARSARWT